MKYINTYKVFESTEVNDEEIAELVEECKDIIETFNESEDKFNLKKRKEHKFPSNELISEIGYQSGKYKIPSGVKTIPVWSSNL
jgi:hypothetical protein